MRNKLLAMMMALAMIMTMPAAAFAGSDPESSSAGVDSEQKVGASASGQSGDQNEANGTRGSQSDDDQGYASGTENKTEEETTLDGTADGDAEDNADCSAGELSDSDGSDGTDSDGTQQKGKDGNTAGAVYQQEESSALLERSPGMHQSDKTGSDEKEKPEKLSIAKAKVKGLKTRTYTGRAIKPLLKITFAGKKLKAGRDYFVKYSNNKAVGTAKVTIKGKGAYKGTVKKTFRIKLGKPSLKLSKNGRGVIKVSWKKVKGAKGYIIYRASSKKGKFKKIKTVKGSKSGKYKDEEVSINETYYYKVRAFGKSGKKKVYSGYKEPKKIENSLNYSRSFNVRTTAYCVNGITASGKRSGFGRVAVDPRVIPLGTWLYIEGYGICQACDTGGAIKGRIIDLFFPSYGKCIRWGRKTNKVYILK